MMYIIIIMINILMFNNFIILILILDYFTCYAGEKKASTPYFVIVTVPVVEYDPILFTLGKQCGMCLVYLTAHFGINISTYWYKSGFL